jgi:hypothetical protein
MATACVSKKAGANIQKQKRVGERETADKRLPDFSALIQVIDIILIRMLLVNNIACKGGDLYGG